MLATVSGFPPLVASFKSLNRGDDSRPISFALKGVEEMSVLKSKRDESRLEVESKSIELAVYTIKACNNEKIFPKRTRWSLANKIVDCVVEVNNNIYNANDIYVLTQEDFKDRMELQRSALKLVRDLPPMIALAYEVHGIDGRKINHWIKLVIEVRDLIKKWHKADYKRFKDI